MSFSKTLLGLRFMQKTKENAKRKLDEAEGTDAINVDKNMLDLCKSESDKYLSTESYSFCEDLKYGRFSYKGMNPEVERIMKSKQSKFADGGNEDDQQGEEQAEVNNEQMANFYRNKKSKKMRKKR